MLTRAEVPMMENLILVRRGFSSMPVFINVAGYERQTEITSGREHLEVVSHLRDNIGCVMVAWVTSISAERLLKSLQYANRRLNFRVKSLEFDLEPLTCAKQLGRL